MKRGGEVLHTNLLHFTLTPTLSCNRGANVGTAPQRRSYVRSCSMGSECTLFFRRRKLATASAPPHQGADFTRYISALAAASSRFGVWSARPLYLREGLTK